MPRRFANPRRADRVAADRLLRYRAARVQAPVEHERALDRGWFLEARAAAHVDYVEAADDIDGFGRVAYYAPEAHDWDSGDPLWQACQSLAVFMPRRLERMQALLAAGDDQAAIRAGLGLPTPLDAFPSAAVPRPWGWEAWLDWLLQGDEARRPAARHLLLHDPENLAAFVAMAGVARYGPSIGDGPPPPTPMAGGHPQVWQPLALLTYPVWVRPLWAFRGGTAGDLMAHLLGRHEVPAPLTHLLLAGGTPFFGTAPLFCEPEFLAWWVGRAQGVPQRELARRLGVHASSRWLHRLESNSRLASVVWPLHGWNQAWSHALMHVVFDPQSAEDDHALDRIAAGPWIPPFADRTRGASDRWNEDLAGLQDLVEWCRRHALDLDDSTLNEIVAWAAHTRSERERDNARGARGRPPNPPFRMRGRSLAAVLRQALADEREHRRMRDLFELAMQANRVPPADRDWASIEPDWTRSAWASHLWDWAEPAAACDDSNPEPASAGWRVRELLDSRALLEEGAAQSHCVGSYALACTEGRCAIFQLLRDDKRHLTIEVDPVRRLVIQARGRFNARPEAEERVALQTWVDAVDLSIAPGV